MELVSIRILAIVLGSTLRARSIEWFVQPPGDVIPFRSQIPQLQMGGRWDANRKCAERSITMAWSKMSTIYIK
jgi:hypothetical protein